MSSTQCAAVCTVRRPVKTPLQNPFGRVIATVSCETVDSVDGSVDLLTGALHATIASAVAATMIDFTVSVLVDNVQFPTGTSSLCPRAASLLLETLGMPDTPSQASLT